MENSLQARFGGKINIENICVSLTVGRKKTTAPDNIIHTGMHTHAYTEIFACINGEITVNTENGEFNLHSGDIGIVPPGFMHIVKNLSNESSGYAVGVMISELKMKSNVNLYTKLSLLFSGRKGNVFKNQQCICENVKKLILADKNSEYLALLNFVVSLVELAEQKMKEISDISYFAGDSEIERNLQLENLINTEFTEQLTAKNIAERLFVSERQLSRIVKKRYGTTLRNVIVEKRLQAAVKLLEHTEKSNEKIAEETGFGTAKSFCREFLRFYGVTPKEYRNQKISKITS